MVVWSLLLTVAHAASDARAPSRDSASEAEPAEHPAQRSPSVAHELADCRGRAARTLDYAELLAAQPRIVAGLSDAEVLECLGRPDRQQPADSPEDWYDAAWSYDLLSRAGAPTPASRRDPWSIEVRMRAGRVVHVRVISWLE